MIATKSGIKRRKAKSPQVPDYLVSEILDGQPLHYQGYREVMSGTKTFSEVMGSSGLQSLIIAYLQRLLFAQMTEDKFTILSNEAGMHLDRGNNLAGDILIYDTATLPATALDEHYLQLPPKIVIEVDINIDVADIHPDHYLLKKTQKLLDFGVEKVIWITTQAKKVTVATAHEDWQTKDWNKDVAVLEGVVFNVGQYLTKKGSPFA